MWQKREREKEAERGNSEEVIEKGHVRELKFLCLVGVNNHLLAMVTNTEPVPIVHSTVSQSDPPDPHGGRARVVHAKCCRESERLHEHCSFCKEKRVHYFLNIQYQSKKTEQK